jgi:rhodanese-related sulfurtransferase
MKTVDRKPLKTMLDGPEQIVLVEVLARDRYEQFHLPGAINVPLDASFEQSIQEAVPEKNAKVVVYSLDETCQASSQAARRLERLGYKRVYDYAAGKVDWRDAEMPVEAAP